MREQFADVIEGTAKPVSKKKAKQITDESDSNEKEGIGKVANVVYDAAVNGSIPATFYLDRRGGWGQRLEVTGQNGGPVTLSALREQFADVIEGTAKPVSKKKAKQITDESES